MPHLQQLMREAQVRALEDEEIGVRHRLLNYYIPLLLQWANGRGAHPESMRVLDCGCGNGASVEFLAAAGFQAFGIDLASLRADSWKQRARLPGVNLIQADATRLPFANHEFDIVLSSGMLEHIGVAESCTPEYRVAPLANQRELRQAFLSESMRVLRPGGVLYLDHPNGAFPIDFWHNDWKSRPRVHMPLENFLPSFGEVKRLVEAIAPGAQVQAISPPGRFTYRRSHRRWYLKWFSSGMEGFFNLVKHGMLSSLAKSPLNPYLVIRIQPMKTSSERI
jgi:SAM-dependent methyltransferase